MAVPTPENRSIAVRAQSGLDVIAQLFFGVGALGISVLMVLTVVGVFYRYVLADPIFGVQDISSMTAAIVAASAVAYGAARNAHITVNIMPKQFGRPVRRFTDVPVRFGGAVILFFAARALIKKGACGLPCGNVTSNLNIPHGPFYFFIAAALGFFALYLTVQMLVALANWQGEDPNEVVE